MYNKTHIFKMNSIKVQLLKIHKSKIKLIKMYFCNNNNNNSFKLT